MLKDISSFLGILVLLLGIGWTVAKPHAENLIEQTVAGKFKVIDNRIATLEQTIIDAQAEAEEAQSIQQMSTNQILLLLQDLAKEEGQ